MADKTTFIKLDRNILDWRWWGNEKTLKFWLYCLVKANVTDHDFERITVHRGQFVSSYANMSVETNLTVRNIRTAIEHLKSTGELTQTIYPKYSLFTVVNYNKYQDTPTSKVTSNRQATDTLPTSNRQQYKNDKNEKNVNKSVAPTLDEIKQFVSDRGNKIDAGKFFDYYSSIGWKGCTDWKAKVRYWERTEQNKPEEAKDKYATYDINAYEEYLNRKEFGDNDE